MKKHEHRNFQQPLDHQIRQPFHENRRVILLFAFVFGLITILIISAVIVISIQLSPISISFPSMMDDHMMMGERSVWPIGGFFVILVALFFISRWSRTRLSIPLEKILDAADQISTGDLTTRIEGIGRGPFLRVQLAVNRMVEELQRSDQHRRNQTADIAHELNTPIHIIRGYLEGISDKIYQPDDEMIKLLLEETSLLSRLVEDLRLLSLADAGKLPTHPELVNLNEVFEDIRVSFQGQANEQKVTFTTSVASDVFIEADPSHVYRIINNLVSNALSNTPPEGVIKLTATIQGEFVVLNVTDTGNGMEPADLEHIFDRFWRKDKSRQRKDGGGYGLGLSIVQQLVKNNNGTITVESTLGVGTTFTITFARFQAL